MTTDSGIPLTLQPCILRPLNDLGQPEWRRRVEGLTKCPKCTASWTKIQRGIADFGEDCAHGANSVIEIPPNSEHPATQIIEKIGELPWRTIIDKYRNSADYTDADAEGWWLRPDGADFSSIGIRALKEEGRYEVEVGGLIWQEHVEMATGGNAAKQIRDYIEKGMSTLKRYKGYVFDKYASLLVDISDSNSLQFYHVDGTGKHLMLVLHMSDNSTATHVYGGPARADAPAIVVSWEVSSQHDDEVATQLERLIARSRVVNHDASGLLLHPTTIKDGEVASTQSIPAGTLNVMNGNIIHAGPTRPECPDPNAQRVVLFQTMTRIGNQPYDKNQTWGQLHLLALLTQEVWRGANEIQRQIFIERFDAVVQEYRRIGVPDSSIRHNIDIDVGVVSRTLQYITHVYLADGDVDLSHVMEWDYDAVFVNGDAIVRHYTGSQLNEWGKLRFMGDLSLLGHVREMADTFGLALMFEGAKDQWHEHVEQIMQTNGKTPVSVTDHGSEEDSLGLQQAVQKGVGWEVKADKLAGTPLVKAASKVLDTVCPEGAVTNGQLFGSTPASKRDLVENGLIRDHEKGRKNTGCAGALTPSMSIAWGCKPQPRRICCDHEQWRLCCLYDSQVAAAYPRNADRTTRKIQGDWSLADRRCACGEDDIAVDDYHNWKRRHGLEIATNNTYIRDLAMEKTKHVGGSTVHCDPGDSALGVLVAGRKRITLIDRASSARAIVLADGRLRISARPRGDVRDINAPLHTITVGHGNKGAFLTDELHRDGIIVETFEVEAGSVYYLPAMMFHEFLDMECMESEGASQPHKRPRCSGKGGDKPKQRSTGKGKAADKDNEELPNRHRGGVEDLFSMLLGEGRGRPNHGSVTKGRMVDKDTAIDTEKHAASGRSTGRVLVADDTGTSLKEPGSDDTPVTVKPSTIASRMNNNHEDALRTRYDLVCQHQDEAIVKYSHKHQEGETIGVHKAVALEHLTRGMKVKQSTSRSTSTDTDTIPPVGSTAEWITPKIVLTRHGLTLKDLAITHVEEHPPPGTSWEKTECDPSDHLDGRKCPELCKLVNQAANGGDVATLTKEDLEALGTPTLSYGDVMRVGNNNYMVVFRKADQLRHLERCLDVLDRGQHQRGCTRPKYTRSMAENIFTPRIFTLYSSDLTAADREKVEEYLRSISCLWTPEKVCTSSVQGALLPITDLVPRAQVTRMMASQLVIFVSANDAAVLGPSPPTVLSPSSAVRNMAVLLQCCSPRRRAY